MTTQWTDKRGAIRTLVTVVGYSHDVDRFGRIHNCALTVLDESREDVEVVALDDGTPLEDLTAVMTLPPQVEIELVHGRVVHHPKEGEVSIYHIPDSSTLPLTDSRPKCCHCQYELTEALGTLYCTHVDCPARLFARIEYFVLNSNAPLEYQDVLNIKSLVQDLSQGNRPYPGMFIDLILPGFKTSYGAKLYGDDTALYLEMFYAHIVKCLYYFPGVEDYLQTLVKFIMTLSIPGVTAREIYQIASDTASVREHPYLLSTLATALENKDRSYAPFSKELRELSAQLHSFVRE